MSQTYTLLIKSNPDTSENQLHGFQLAKSLINRGNKIDCVFFYSDGVQVANKSRIAPQDETNIQTLWQTLKTNHQIPLKVCVANSVRRGIVGDKEKNQFKMGQASIAEGFEIVGLGDFVEATMSSSKVVTL